MVNIQTANGFTEWLYNVVGEDELTPDDQETWASVTFEKPMLNTMIATTETGKQYIISVRPVSK